MLATAAAAQPINPPPGILRGAPTVGAACSSAVGYLDPTGRVITCPASALWTLSGSNAVASFGNRTVFIGDSITADSGGTQAGNNPFWGLGWIYQASMLSLGRIEMVYNAGVSGNTCAQVLARLTTDAWPYNPDKLVLMCGTNDAGTGVSLATTKANITSIAQAALARGVLPILCTIPPNSNLGRRTANRLINLAVLAVAQSLHVPAVDLYASVAGVDGGWASASYTVDGQHPSALGAKLMGQYFIASAAMNSFGPSALPLAMTSTDTTNLVPSPLFEATSTGDCMQTVTASWGGCGYGNAPAVAPTFSFVTDQYAVGRWYRMVMAASSGGAWTIGPNGVVPGSVGDVIAVFGKIRISGLEAAGSGYLTITLAVPSSAILFQWGTDITLGSFYLEHTVTSDEAGGIAPALQMPITNGGDVTIDIAQFGIVNLTTQGLR